MTIKNGDMPAKPIEINGFGQFAPEAFIGLTKREMFAMAAMQGILSSETDARHHNNEEALAESAVKCADALLSQLERTK